MQRGFGWLVRNEPRLDANLRALLGRIYNLKAIADHETGPGSHVSAEGAGAASRIRAALRGVHHNSYPAEMVGTCARTGLRCGRYARPSGVRQCCSDNTKNCRIRIINCAPLAPCSGRRN